MLCRANTSEVPPDFTINEDSIQINEISSSSGDDSATFDGDIENNASGNSPNTLSSIRRHSLRSSHVSKPHKSTGGDENAKKYVKPKEEQQEASRKSIRINSKQLPKLSESSSTSKNATTKNISLTQSILNAKESEVQQLRNKNKDKKSVSSKSLAKQLKKLMKPKTAASVEENVQKRPPFVTLQDTAKKCTLRTPKSSVLLKEPTPAKSRSRRSLEDVKSQPTTSQKSKDRKSSRLRDKIAKKTEILRSNVQVRKSQKKAKQLK